MSTIPSFSKDPDAVVDFAVDWTAWLAGDTISSSTWTVPNGITQASASNTPTKATIWLSGGAAQASYAVTNRIVTAGGRTQDQTILVAVSPR